MSTIRCKKCGVSIDAKSGECPVCGTVYYVLSQDETEEKSLKDEAKGKSNNNVMKTGSSSDFKKPTAPGAKDDDDMIFDVEAQRTLSQMRLDDAPPIEKGNRPPGFEFDISEQTTTSSRPVREGPARPAPGRTQSGDAVRIGEQREPTASSGGSKGRKRPPAPGSKKARGMSVNGQAGTPEGPKGRLDNRMLLLGGIGVLAVLTLIICFAAGVFSFGKNNDENIMPEVVGKTIAEAQDALADFDIKLETILEDSDEPENTVIKQSAKQGKKLNKGEVVMLTLSNGKGSDDSFDAPNFVGRKYELAQTAAEARGLTMRKIAEESSDKTKGEIIKQEPSSGTKVSKGDIIKVTVSSGSEDASPSPTSSSGPSQAPQTQAPATQAPAGSTISVTSGTGGGVYPKGRVSVSKGGSQSFTITANEGYEIAEVIVDGVSKGAISGYTFDKVSGDHTIYARFQKKAAATQTPATQAPQTQAPATQAPATQIPVITAPPQIPSTVAPTEPPIVAPTPPPANPEPPQQPEEPMVIVTSPIGEPVSAETQRQDDELSEKTEQD